MNQILYDPTGETNSVFRKPQSLPTNLWDKKVMLFDIGKLADIKKHYLLIPEVGWKGLRFSEDGVGFSSRIIENLIHSMISLVTGLHSSL